MRISTDLFLGLLCPLKMCNGQLRAWHCQNLPDDTKVIDACFDMEHNEWLVKIESESFNKVLLGEAMEPHHVQMTETWVREISAEEAAYRYRLSAVLGGAMAAGHTFDQSWGWSGHDVCVCSRCEQSFSADMDMGCADRCPGEKSLRDAIAEAASRETDRQMKQPFKLERTGMSVEDAVQGGFAAVNAAVKRDGGFVPMEIVEACRKESERLSDSPTFTVTANP